ncbi:MAG: hypothetical protein ABIJ59_12815 [Pseudomonadota bacterium]
MMRKDRAKQATALITALRELNTEGMVCDSIEECQGWKNYKQIQSGLNKIDLRLVMFDILKTFKFCAWCGRELDWQNWGRLKSG